MSRFLRFLASVSLLAGVLFFAVPALPASASAVACPALSGGSQYAVSGASSFFSYVASGAPVGVPGVSLDCVDYYFPSGGTPQLGVGLSVSTSSSDVVNVVGFFPVPSSTSLSSTESNLSGLSGCGNSLQCYADSADYPSYGYTHVLSFAPGAEQVVLSPYLAQPANWPDSVALSSPPPWFLLCVTVYSGYNGYASDCLGVALGSAFVPMPAGYPTCSVAADLSTSTAVLQFSDGEPASSDTRGVSVNWGDASAASVLSQGSGSVGHAYASPVSSTPYQVVVTWTTGESCATVADFYNTTGNSSGNPTGGAAGGSSGSGLSTAPDVWSAAGNCAPSGWGILNPVSLLQALWCYTQAAFVPTTADVSYLQQQLSTTPVLGTALSAVNQIVNSFSNVSATSGGFAIPAFSGSVGSSGDPVQMKIPAMQLAASSESGLAGLFYGFVAFAMLGVVLWSILEFLRE